LDITFLKPKKGAQNKNKVCRDAVPIVEGVFFETKAKYDRVVNQWKKRQAGR
jgi:hypothetical protein